MSAQERLAAALPESSVKPTIDEVRSYRLETPLPYTEEGAATTSLNWQKWRAHKRTEIAAVILAADSVLKEAIEFGLAWQEAEAALPGSDWMLEVVRVGAMAGDTNPHTGYVLEQPTNRYQAVAQPAWHTRDEALGLSDSEPIEGWGSTPAAALRALTEKLRAG